MADLAAAAGIGRPTDWTKCLVEGFGDSGQRLYQAFSGKIAHSVPEGLASHTVLVSGRTGIGKSLLLTTLAHHFGCEVTRVHLGRVVASGNQHSGLKQLLARVPADRPALVWFVDLELFRGAYGAVVGDFVNRARKMPRCLVAMTTRVPERALASLRCIADDHIRLLSPGKSERLQLCRWFTKDKIQMRALDEIAGGTHGKISAELFAALISYTKQQEKGQLSTDRSVASSGFPAKLEGSAPNVRWSDIGGLDGVIEELKETIIWPLQYRDQFRRLGIRPPRGVLLHGPPGTGKTMLARAAATEVSANFIAIAIPDLIKGEVGESEKALAAVFENAIRSPSILFLDEIEAIFGDRESSGEVGKKLISQLFLEMDSIPEDASVVILAATNAPDLMDTSILRSGRLDKMIHIPRPSYSSRLDILKRATEHLALDDTDNLLAWLAEFDMSGAEIKSLVRSACYCAIQRGSKELLRADFETALAAMETGDAFARK